jgi:hypothetical protein
MQHDVLPDSGWEMVERLILGAMSDRRSPREHITETGSSLHGEEL